MIEVRKVHNLSFISLIIAILAGMYSIGKNFLVGDVEFTGYEFLMIFLIFSISLLGFFFLERKSLKHNYPMLIGMGTVFILSIVMIYLMQSPQDPWVLGLHGEYWQVHFEVNSFFRVESIARLFIIMSLSYATLILVPQIFNKGKMVLILFILIGVMTILILYSLIAEFNNYVTFIKCLLNSDPEGMVLASPKALFPNKNGFAFVLFLNIVGLILLHHYKRYKFTFVYMIITYILILFTICKTIMILGFLLPLIYVIYRLVVTYQDNKKRNLIVILVSTSLFLIALIIVLAVPVLRNNIFDMFFNIGGRTIDVRQYIWSNALIILGVSGWFTGRGYGTFNTMITIYNHSDPGGGEGFAINAHNGYLELIGEGGIFYLLLALMVEGYLVYKCIKHFKDNKELVMITLLLFVALHIYMVFEAMTPFFSYALDYLAMNFMMFVPILMLEYQMIPEKGEVRNPDKTNAYISLFSLGSICLFPSLFSTMGVFFKDELVHVFFILFGILFLIYLALSILLIVKHKDKLMALIELFIFLVILCPFWAFMSFGISNITTSIIALVTSLSLLILINGVINKLPLNKVYDGIYNYLDDELDILTMRLSK